MQQYETPPLEADWSRGTLVRLFDSSSTATNLTTQSSLERLGERVGRYRSKLSATIEQVNAHAEAVRARIGYYDRRLPPTSSDDPASASAGLHEVWGKLCDIYAALERTSAPATVPPPSPTPEDLEHDFAESKTSLRPPPSDSRSSVDSDRLSAFRSALSVAIMDEGARSSSVDLPATVHDHLSVSQVALSGDSSTESIGPELRKLTESLTALTQLHGSLHRLSSKTDLSLATAAASSCSAAKNSSGSGTSDDRLSALESDLRECESDLERITASSRAAMDLLEANLRQISEAALAAIRGESTTAAAAATVTSQVVATAESEEKPLETTSSVNCTDSSSSVIESSVDHTSFGDDEYCCSERDDTILSSSDQLSGSNIMAVTPLLAQRASSNHEKPEMTTTPVAEATNQKSPLSALISTLSQITSTLSFICPQLDHPTLHSCSSSDSFKTAELSLLSSAPGPPDARSDSVVVPPPLPLVERPACIVADVDPRGKRDADSLLERLKSNRELIVLPLAFFVLHAAITIINSHIKLKTSHRATVSDIGLKPTFKLRI